MKPETIALMLLALVAFASNSLLTRLALGAAEIDAATFTLLRLLSGALVLVGAAVGALVLFGVVQLTMLAYGVARGDRPSARS
jgi:hypothetical protein